MIDALILFLTGLAVAGFFGLVIFVVYAFKHFTKARPPKRYRELHIYVPPTHKRGRES